MKLKIEIDSSCLTDYTSKKEDAELADEFIENATDGAVVEEAVSRGLEEDILDRLSPKRREELFALYGYINGD